MGLDVSLYADESHTLPIEVISLGESILEDGEAGFSHAKPIFAKNIGDRPINEVRINLVGDGARTIQVARDENGAHGIWAQPGEGIVALAGNDVVPGDSFVFWVRAAFTADDAPDALPFKFNFELISRSTED